MVNARVLPIPAFQDNYIWLILNGPDACVIDPGDAEVVKHALDAHQAHLNAILVTHHHLDHIGGVTALANTYHATVHGPAQETIPSITEPHQGGDHFHICGIEFTVLDVPGHTLGHIAYYAPQAGWLFCGDTLFAGGCGRVFEGTPAQMAASLDQLAQLPTHTQIYCAHEYTLANLRFAQAIEPENQALAARVAHCRAQRAQGQPTVPSLLSVELATNPFLRCHLPSVQAAAQTRHPTPDRTPATTFATIRAWKDVF